MTNILAPLSETLRRCHIGLNIRWRERLKKDMDRLYGGVNLLRGCGKYGHTGMNQMLPSAHLLHHSHRVVPIFGFS